MAASDQTGEPRVGPRSPSDPSSPTTPGRRGRRYRGVVTLVVLAVVTLGLWRVARPTGAERVQDRTGRLSLILPGAWSASGDGWTGPDGTVTPPEPSLIVAPDPHAWARSRAVPGAFVTITTHAAATPEAQVAGAAHEGCDRGPTRTRKLGDFTWTLVRFRACPGAGPDWLEAAAAGPGGTVVWAQVAAAKNASDEVADPLLASVRVKPA